MASQHLKGIDVSQNMALGDLIIFGVAATTFIVQLAGPPMVKLAIKLGREAGRNITRQDVVDSLTVADVMQKEVVLINENETLINAAQIFMVNDFLIFPVVDQHKNILGLISLESLKDILVDQSSWEWLVVTDVMAPVRDKAFADEPLQHIIDRMNELNIDEIPVVTKNNGNMPIGILGRANIRKLIDKEVIRRKQPPKTQVPISVVNE